MGWWSTDVLGGDAPLDYLGTLEDRLGVSGLYPLEQMPDAVRRELAAALTDDQISSLLAGASSRTYDGPICIQVLASVVMAAGVPMSTALRSAALAAADDDEWAREGDPERVASMHAFSALVTAYQEGVPTVLRTTGLFESIANLTGQG